MNTRRALWAAWRDNPTDANLSELERAYLPLVRRVARSVAKGIDSDDLLGPGFLGLRKAIFRYEPDRGTAFATYAAKVIYYAMLEALRADRGKEVQGGDLGEGPQDPRPGPYEQAEQKDMWQALMNNPRLSDPQRHLLFAVYALGWTYRDLARDQNCSTTEAFRRVQDARGRAQRRQHDDE